MTPPYTRKNLNEVEDAAAMLGFQESQESRFVRGDDLAAEQTGLSVHRFSRGSGRGSRTGTTTSRRFTSSSPAPAG